MTNTSNGNNLFFVDECPCILCELRDAECHSRCSAYSNWKANADAARKIKNQKVSEDSFFKMPRKHRSVL